MSLNGAATPFVSASPYEAATSYDVEQHLYDTPTNIAHDNRVAVEFLTAHQAPPQFWEQAGYDDPNRTITRPPGASLLLDAMERERERRIMKLEQRVDLMYVIVNSLNEDFSHFALEHWGPFQASLFRYFGRQCRGAYCTDPPQSSPVVPPTPPGLGSSSPSVPSLESCSSSSDGGEVVKEAMQESDDSFWTAVLPVEPGSPSSHAAEAGGSEASGQVWIRVGE
jgi:hypothetical protein